MNVLFWIVAGGVAGWIAYAFLGLNHSRGTWVCVVIGAAGAIVGGMLVAPLFVNPPPGSDFSLPTLVIATAFAGATLATGNFVHDRWGI